MPAYLIPRSRTLHNFDRIARLEWRKAHCRGIGRNSRISEPQARNSLTMSSKNTQKRLASDEYYLSYWNVYLDPLIPLLIAWALRNLLQDKRDETSKLQQSWSFGTWLNSTSVQNWFKSHETLEKHPKIRCSHRTDNTLT